MNEHVQTAGLERRREDYGLVTGLSHYVDDLRPPVGRPAALYMIVVRSPYAHAAIKHIQLDAVPPEPALVGRDIAAKQKKSGDTNRQHEPPILGEGMADPDQNLCHERQLDVHALEHAHELGEHVAHEKEHDSHSDGGAA